MQSGPPPPEETGINSTNSRTNSQAAQEAMELNEGVNRLGKMSGVASNDRNLEAEDAEYKRGFREHELQTSDGTAAPAPGNDEMKVMAARDVHVYERPEPTEPAATLDSPQLPVKAASTLAKFALGAAVLAGTGGAGAGITALLMNRFAQPPAETTDKDTQYEGGIRVE